MPGLPPPSDPGSPEVDAVASVITVVGIGADGWTGLPARLREVVGAAEVVLGGARHLALLPEIVDQRRVPWPSPLRDGLADLLAPLDGVRVVALASGDPMLSGIGSVLVDVLGPDRVRVEPAISSVTLARARMGWPAERTTTVSLVGRGPSTLLRELAPGHRILVLSADETTPGLVATLLVEEGYGASVLTVLGDLGTTTETRLAMSATDWLAAPPAQVPRLHVLAVALAGPRHFGWTTGLPDDAFEHDGQLTKRDLRSSALARLAPVPGEHLWDVGAGAGSIGIEWMRTHPTCSATAIEADPERAARVARNAHRLGVPGLVVVTGRAPAALADLPAPDAVFVGGGAGKDGLLDHCLASLPPGGRLVVHAVTLETEQLLFAAFRQHGGELTRLSIEIATSIGSFTGWTPTRAVTQWALTLPSWATASP